MNKIILGLFLLLSANAWADLWVTVAGSGTADGSSLANACAGGTGGISDTDCTTFADGTTVRYCDAFTTTHTSPNAGTNSSTLNTYTCTCTGGTDGSFSVTSGQAIIANKQYTKYVNCSATSTVSSGIIINASDFEVDGGTYTGSSAGVNIGEAGARSNVTIKNLTARSTAGSGGDSVRLLLSDQASTGRVFSNITIDNVIADNNSRSGFYFAITGADPALATSYFDGITIKNSFARNNANVGLYLYHTKYSVPEQIHKEVYIYNNEFTGNQGGGAAIYAVGLDTALNRFNNNNCSNNVGVTGGLNIFASKYFDIYENNCSGNKSPDDIDGCGILVDNDNQYMWIHSNLLNNNSGNELNSNSGAGLMVLTASDVYAYGNIMMNNRYGIWFAGSGTSSNIQWTNNSIINNSVAGVNWTSNAVEENATNGRNNLIMGSPECLTSGGTSPSQLDSYNHFYNCPTIDDVSWTPDMTLQGDPQLVGGTTPTNVAGVYPRSGSSLARAGIDINVPMTDYTVKAYLHPPTIGAIEATHRTLSPTSRTSYNAR